MSLIGAALAAIALAAATPRPPEPSLALGKPHDGRLAGGVRLPASGEAFFTWDWALERSPNRGWRRWGTARTVATTVAVLEAFRAAHPAAPRIGVADLSRPRGGAFDRRFGGRGHASHQNGRDVDVLYPRVDRRERPPARPAQVDRALAQELVDRFAHAGATAVFIGPGSALRPTRRTVRWLAGHDDHMHVRFAP